MDNQNNQVPQPSSDTPAQPSMPQDTSMNATPTTDMTQPSMSTPQVSDQMVSAPVEVSPSATSSEPSTPMGMPSSPMPTEPSLMSPSSEPVPATMSTETQQSVPTETTPDLVNQPFLATQSAPSAPVESTPVVSEPTSQPVAQPAAEPVMSEPTPVVASVELPMATPEPVSPVMDTTSSAPSMTPALPSSPSEPTVQAAATTQAPIFNNNDNGKKKGISGKTALFGFIIGLVVLSIPVSVLLVQQQQNLMQEAKTKKNVPVRRVPQVVATTPTPTVVPLTSSNVDSQLDTTINDVEDAVSTVDQDLSEVNQVDSQQDNESL